MNCESIHEITVGVCHLTTNLSNHMSHSAFVGFCTDVEGDFAFWNRYLSISKVLSRDANSGRVELADGAHFVFGGDSVDWGSGDLEFLREIIDLHDR